MSNTHTTTVEIPVEVEFTYHKGCRGERDSFGAPLEPDEDPEIEITAVLAGKVDVISLIDKDQLDGIEEEIANVLSKGDYD